MCEKMTLHIKVISSCYHTTIAVLSASSDSAKYPFLHHRNNLSTAHIRTQRLRNTHRTARMLRGRRAAPSERARESRGARSGDPLQPPQTISNLRRDRNNLSTTHIRAQRLRNTHRAARMLRGRRAAPSERARESRCARSGDPLQPPKLSNYLKSTTRPE